MTADESTLARELRRDGIDVEEVTVSPDGVVAVDYLTTLPGEEPDHMELGRVCTTFIDLAERGEWEPSRVEATSLRFVDDVQATWHVEADWFRGLDEYRLSEEEFSARVLDTVETEPYEAGDGGTGTGERGTDEDDDVEDGDVEDADGTEGDGGRTRSADPGGGA